jgi:hypothetical protein
MNVDVIPTLIDEYRETFEREVRPGVCWIVDARWDAGVFGTRAAARPARRTFLYARRSTSDRACIARRGCRYNLLSG